MSSLRNRMLRSSSHGETGALNQLRPMESPVAFFAKKNPVAVTSNFSESVNNESRKTDFQCIFTLGSPEIQKNESPLLRNKNPGEGFGEFLKNCSLCKKKLKENEVIYMYGYLGAFCSMECREDRQALDGFNEEIDKDIASKQLCMQKSRAFKLK